MVRIQIAVAFALACGASTAIDEGPDGSPRECATPDTIEQSAVCPGRSALERPHAAEGDSICADKADCSGTSGQPDHKGCPSTCSCLCYCGACYAGGGCTAIACDAGPVYR